MPSPRSTDETETADLPIPAMVAAARAPRLDSVDLLRGLIMVFIALDHTRDFFSHLHFPPEDMSQTWPFLFLTRWLTHFSAPGFFFLAGTGAYLSLSRGRSSAKISHFLWTRGLWLVLLEMTLIGFAWTFVPSFGFGGVIWALGWYMVVNAAILRLPMRWIVAVGAAMVAGHNLLDHIQPQTFGKLGWLWLILHQPGFIPLPQPSFIHLPPGVFFGFFVLYPLVPWIGVMALGYAFGSVLRRPPEERQRWTLRAGVALTLLFLLLRGFNAYGNPSQGFIGSGAWSGQSTLGMTLVSFFNTTKYPPSLQFLLMTLGPSLVALSCFDRLAVKDRLGALGRSLVVFGRVPLFYYILHLFPHPRHGGGGGDGLGPALRVAAARRILPQPAAAGLRPQPALHLPDVGAGGRHPVFPLQVVHGPEAATARLVAELPVAFLQTHIALAIIASPW
jgi:uncharacterized membrane protein